MDVLDIVEKMDCLFEITNKDVYARESGITYLADKKANKIGYCVNLTVETIKQANKHGVDMIITHHDAWDEIFGLKEACKEKLVEYGISHYYNHLPLDDCSFGTNDSLLHNLKLKLVNRTHTWEGLYFGRVGEYQVPITFGALVKQMESLLEEPVKYWQFHDKKIKRVGLVCGDGGSTTCLKEAVENLCDVYITGECNLYTIQFAELNQINLIVGSHTYTEFFGIQNLALRLRDQVDGLEVVRLDEPHYEASRDWK